MEGVDICDKSDYKKALLEFPEQIDKAAALGRNLQFQGDFKNVVVVGIGGSGICGELLKTLYEDELDVITINDFSMPKQVTKDSLVFIVSYSGNTEETIDMYRNIARKNAKTIVITSGGKLEQLAPMYKSEIIKIPQGYQPRQALAYTFFPMLSVLSKQRMVSDPKARIISLIKLLQNDVYQVHAKEFAEKIHDKIPIIYASKRLLPVAYRWKTQINENVKRHAFCGKIPEVDHNEILAYTNKDEKFYSLIIKDQTNDSSKVKVRMDLLKETIKQHQNGAMEVVVKGEDMLIKLFSTIYLGDWVSYYVAVNNNIDPTPVVLIEEFKKKL
jgi:glucose/mannose-6-phosphate isomerase